MLPRDLACVDAAEAVTDEAHPLTARLDDLLDARDRDGDEPVEAEDLGPAPLLHVVAARSDEPAQAGR